MFTWVSLVTDVSSIPVIAVAGYGYESGGGVIALLDDGGQELWHVETASIPFGAALPQDGQLWAAGSAAGEAVLHAYDDQGLLLEELTGPPYAPVGATFFDPIAVPGGGSQAPATTPPCAAREGFLRESNAGGSVTTSLTFAPSTDTEVLRARARPSAARVTLGWSATPARRAAGSVASTTASARPSRRPSSRRPSAPTSTAWRSTPWATPSPWVGTSTHGTHDPYVVKVAPGGEVVWSATEITDEGDDDLRDVAVGEDGAIYVVGTRIDVGGTAQAWIARLTP